MRRPASLRWRGSAVAVTTFLGLSMLLPASTDAFVLLNPFRKWLTSDIPAGGVHFVIDNRGEDSVTAADGSSDHGLTQVIGATLLWNEAANRTITAAPVKTAITTFNVADGQNSIVFNDPLGICTGSCLAATFVGAYDNGQTETVNGIAFAAYVETDITFNATVNWTTAADAAGPGCSNEFDIEGTATHEMGHALGLGHSSNSAATMYAFAEPCDASAASLDLDDVAAIDCVYVNGAGCALCENCPQVPGVLVPAEQVFACGSGFTFMSAGVSTHGNLAILTSPQGVPHINPTGTGFGLCIGADSAAPAYYDLGGDEGGWSGDEPLVSQPNGPNTFPLRVTRTTADGAYTVLREITGNSFVMTVSGGGTYDINGNHKLCDTMAECGNCSNRTIHVLTRVTKNTPGSESVQIIEAADFDAGGTVDNTWAHTSDSVMAFLSKDATDSIDATHYGVLLQGLILPSNPSKYPFTGRFPGDCLGGDLGADGTVAGNFQGYLRIPFGTLNGGANTGNAIRVHYRRY